MTTFFNSGKYEKIDDMEVPLFGKPSSRRQFLQMATIGTG